LSGKNNEIKICMKKVDRAKPCLTFLRDSTFLTLTCFFYNEKQSADDQERFIILE